MTMSSQPPAEHWIERRTEVMRVTVWRSAVRGEHYVAKVPEDAGDKEIGRQDTVRTTGLILGSYPELGTVESGNNRSVITRVDDVVVEPVVYYSDRGE